MSTGTNNSFHYAVTRTESLVRAFLNSRRPITEVLKQAELLLSCEDLPQAVQGPTIDTTRFMDRLYEVYTMVDVQEKHFLDLLRKFYRSIEQLPSSALLSASAGLEKSHEIPMKPEGFMEIWPGRYQGAQVTIKAPRTRSAQNLEEVKEILRTAALALEKLDHPNIAVFHGVTYDLFRVGLVYDWEGDANILGYVNTHPETSRLALLLPVAEALQYLHSRGFIHGNLRPRSVLVSSSGHVRVTDYGLAALNANSNLTAVLPDFGNVRWLAPEILDSDNDLIESKPADVFAFGITGIEVFTGQPPYGDFSDLVVSLQILGGVMPEFPHDAETAGLTSEVQELLRGCLNFSPARRMTIDEVVKECRNLLGNVRCPQPTPLPRGAAGQLTRPDQHISPPIDIDDSLHDVVQFIDPRGRARWWRKYLCVPW